MKKMTCTPENVAEFNVALRQHADLLALARALHGAGMIDGLAGARIGPAGALPELGAAVQPVLSDEAEARHADAQWARSSAR